MVSLRIVAVQYMNRATCTWQNYIVQSWLPVCEADIDKKGIYDTYEACSSGSHAG